MNVWKNLGAAVKFCFLLGKNAAETVVMLKTAYKDSAMAVSYTHLDVYKRQQLYNQYSCFVKCSLCYLELFANANCLW